MGRRMCKRMPAPEIRLSITPYLSDRTDYDVYFIDGFEGIVELLDFYRQPGNLYTSMLFLLRRTKTLSKFNTKLLREDSCIPNNNSSVILHASSRYSLTLQKIRL